MVSKTPRVLPVKTGNESYIESLFYCCEEPPWPRQANSDWGLDDSFAGLALYHHGVDHEGTHGARTVAKGSILTHRLWEPHWAWCGLLKPQNPWGPLSFKPVQDVSQIKASLGQNFEVPSDAKTWDIKRYNCRLQVWLNGRVLAQHT